MGEWEVTGSVGEKDAMDIDEVGDEELLGMLGDDEDERGSQDEESDDEHVDDMDDSDE